MLPTRDAISGLGKEYLVSDLYEDQCKIVSVVIDKLQEFLHSEDLTKFEPLRMTINGAGGSGKSVVINTLVTVFRKMFQFNEVIRVMAPTGAAAFNVGGDTFHHSTATRPSHSSYRPMSMSDKKRKMLIQKFKMLLCVIVDERSLAQCKDLGTTGRKIGETIFDGGPLIELDLALGGLPILILVGDDYQLPSFKPGAFSALHRKEGCKMEAYGRDIFISCGKFVMDLKGSKRVKDDKVFDKELMEAVRLQKDLSEAQVDKLMNLHIENFERRHGSAERQKIEEKAIYLFYTNAKRTRHNLRQLANRSSMDNPVAILKTQSYGTVTGKADARHFDASSKLPPLALLCIGATVAITDKNFYPSWGLHNGACGVVDEIVFDKGKNPNNGDLPKYIVVEFPLYCGPIWDNNNSKVSAI